MRKTLHPDAGRDDRRLELRGHRPHFTPTVTPFVRWSHKARTDNRSADKHRVNDRRSARAFDRVLIALMLAIAATLLLILWSPPAFADDIDAKKAGSPYFHVQGADPGVDALPLKATQVDVRIAGVIADVTVTQKYRNEGQRPIEARYVFPGSTRAAVHAMNVRIGDRLIAAQIREKRRAQIEYQAAKQEGKTAALLEQERPNVFQMNVANILPGDDVAVELRYTELIAPTEGRYEFVFPTVVGPRYQSPNNAGRDTGGAVLARRATVEHCLRPRAALRVAAAGQRHPLIHARDRGRARRWPRRGGATRTPKTASRATTATSSCSTGWRATRRRPAWRFTRAPTRTSSSRWSSRPNTSPPTRSTRANMSSWSISRGRWAAIRWTPRKRCCAN